MGIVEYLVGKNVDLIQAHLGIFSLFSHPIHNLSYHPYTSSQLF